ncbi:porin [Dyella terrae]|uniref:Porin n=3 Tax=Rhodanobacteraceae TaxID=1775411 RepID=A0A4R0YQC0_9GAMM|nr:porin [Dyella terrae]TCI08761.1 porin [Dyella soli]
MNGRHTALALGIAAALLLPLGAHADPQSSGKTKSSSSSSAKEQALENRVSQLESELAELKDMLRQQQSQQQQQAQQVQQVQQQQQVQQAQAEKVVAAAPKSTFESAPGLSVALHGFISASAFSQTKNMSFGNGQNAEYPIPKSAAAPYSGSLSGVDIRNTRFWLDFKGAKFNDSWTGGGRIEMDFFGGFNGTGPYSEQQPVPRLRQAYMDITNKESGTTFRVGEQWNLMFPLDIIPTSLSHIAFPLGFGNGMIGWRFPGVVWMQDLNSGDGPRWRVDVGAFSGNWNGPGDNVNYLTAGNAGFRPQIEARVSVKDKAWMAFFAAHWSQIDLRGVGQAVNPPIKDSITSTAYELGGQWKPGSWTFKGFIYTGNGIGQIFGDLSQFGDISDKGGYFQVGYNFTPKWSVNAYYGQSRPDQGDVRRWVALSAFPRLNNRQSAMSLQYATGAYELGIEYLYSKLKYATTATEDKSLSGSQVSLNAMYKF